MAEQQAVSREVIVAELAAHPGEGHRAIAARLGTSASSVDRACRAARQASGAECLHGRQAKAFADASAVTRADAGDGVKIKLEMKPTVRHHAKKQSATFIDPDAEERAAAVIPVRPETRPVTPPDAGQEAPPAEPAVTVPDASPGPVSDSPVTGYETCAQCGRVQDHPGGRNGRCEQCACLLAEPEPVDPALRWSCPFCHWHQLREAERCEHCGWPRERETPR